MVVVTALLLGIYVFSVKLWQRSRSYQLLAEEHAILEQNYRKLAEIADIEAQLQITFAQMEECDISGNAYRAPESRRRRAASLMEMQTQWKEEQTRAESLADYHSRAKRKLRFAALRPWISIHEP